MDFLKYVNIKQGTKSSQRFSNGNTLPLVQRPFGFASFAPQTNSSRKSWFYHPEDKSFEGVRLTHQPSPWISDHGAIVIHPQSEIPYLPAYARWSGFDENETILKPHYMRYFLKRSKINFELTPTEYGACMRINYGTDFERYFSVLPVEGKCEYKLDAKKNILFCSTECNELKGYDKGKITTYFVFKFEDCTVDADKTMVDRNHNKTSGTRIKGKDTGIHVYVNSNEIVVKMASSNISYKQALINLDRDSKYSDFDDLKEQNEKIWNSYISRIEIDADEEVMKTFYSCMYRLFLYPHKAYEIDKDGNAVHYSPSCDEVRSGVRYTDNGFWDTYRTNYPLYSMIAREEYKEILEGFISDYKDGGWLPCWTAGDAKKCMPSTMIDAVIADAAVKGVISGVLLETAFEGMEKHANNASENPAYGREGCEDYLRLGYVPCDKYKESVNLTLDASYGDYCLGTVAKILGKNDKAEKYFARAKNYKNIFDSETGFMRGRKTDGSFNEDFDPIKWGSDYTEAAAWQTTFAVQHDLEGLCDLYGTKENLLSKLDEFFASPLDYRVGGYYIEIHEMTEFAAGNWGQCAISNQPSFHIPFIYAYLGETQKTSYWVKRMCLEGFSWSDDGFPGDEDNGSMAAWYIFSVLGKYPLCPGKNELVEFEGLAKKVKFNI